MRDNLASMILKQAAGSGGGGSASAAAAAGLAGGRRAGATGYLPHAGAGGYAGAGARGRRGGSSARLLSLSAALVGTKNAAALARSLRTLKHATAASARQDMARLQALQSRALSAVTKGTATVARGVVEASRGATAATVSALATGIQRGAAAAGMGGTSAAVRPGAPGSGAPSSSSAARDLTGISSGGAAGSVGGGAAGAQNGGRRGSGGAGASRRGRFAAELAEIAGPSSSSGGGGGGAGAAAGSRRARAGGASAAHAAASAAALVASAAAEGGAGELGALSSAAADTVIALSYDVHWWWGGSGGVTSAAGAAGAGAGAGAASTGGGGAGSATGSGDYISFASSQGGPQLYLEHVVLHALAANVSFARDPLCVQESAAASRSLTRSVLVSPLTVTLNALGVMALSLNRVPLRLNGLEMVNVMAGRSDLAARLGQHYVSCALSEAYKLVFASDVLGNPVAVLSALGTGVRDFFVEPAQGLVQSPLAFGRGLVRGTGSLLRHTVVGLGTGLSSISSSVGAGVAALSLDSGYLRDRATAAAARTHGGPGGGGAGGYAGGGGSDAAAGKPAHIGEGLLQGTRDLGRGVAQGLAGVVLDPLRGAEAEGAAGFVKGVGRGVAGLVAKPVAGVLDFAARTSEGLVATAKALGGGGGDDGGGDAPIARRRHQRLLWGIDRAVVPHEPLHGLIVAIMRRALEVAAAAATAPASAGGDGLGGGSGGGRPGGKGKGGAASPPGSSGGRGKYGSASSGGGGGGHLGGSGGGGGSGGASGPGSAAYEEATLLLHDVRDVMSGLDASLRLALANISATYLHHVAWPRTPYLLVVTTRALIFARINRSAAGAGSGGGGGGGSGGGGSGGGGGGGLGGAQVVNLCWQTPVVTASALSSAHAAALLPARAGVSATQAAGAALADAVAEVADAAAAASSGGAGGSAGGAGAASASLAALFARRGRSGVPVGALAGHVAFSHLLDAMTEIVTEAAEAAQVAASMQQQQQQQGRAAQGPGGPGAPLSPAASAPAAAAAPAAVALLSPPRRAAIRRPGAGGSGSASAAGGGRHGPSSAAAAAPAASAAGLRASSPFTLMALDSLVLRQLSRLCARRLDDAAFALPAHLVTAMTVAVEPAPLYFADAIATVANLRPDAHPQANVASITLSLAYVDASYSRYVRDRVEYLQSPAGASIPGAAAEVARLTRNAFTSPAQAAGDDASGSGRAATAAPAPIVVRHVGLETDDLVPVFNYIVAKSAVDRPVLCGVLASAWLAQQGMGKGRDGFALSMFKAACAWAASTSL